MKKLFFFIPALALSLLANATKTTINNSTDDALRLALHNSSAGDTIVMSAGVYEESNSDYIAWKRSNVVMAAEGATVTIKPHVSFRVRNGARAELIGVKIDASELNKLSSSYENIFEVHDATAGNCWVLKNCEVYGNSAKTMLRHASGKTLDSVIINGCYIHNNPQTILRLQDASLKGVIIKNSTFAEIANGGSFWCAPMDISTTAADAKVVVDHCTFYHNTSISSSYADVTVGYDGSATSDVTITNCIFAQPASYDGSRAINLVNGGTVRNCLTFNYTKSTNGIQGATVKENCIAVDPNFTDAEHADYSFPGNWATMELSPARGAATDGSDLGDPRWYSAETLLSVDFATPYQFVGAKALLAGKIWYDSENDYLYGDGGSNKDYGTATWKFHAEKAGVVGVSANLNSGNTSGHKLRVEVLDADGNSVGEFAEQTSTLPGTLIIPAAGDYKIILHDDQTWSSAKIDNVTLSYIGGAVQNIASATNTTVDVSEAWYSAGGSRADGKISFPGDLIATSWIRWNVHVADSKYYDITVNFSSDNGHNIGIRLFNDERSIEISEGGQTSAASPLELGRLSIPAGDYTMELTNPVSHSHAQIISVLFAPVAASATELPGTLEFGNAVLSDRAHVTDGNLYFAPIGDTNPAGEWAAWAVTTDHNGTFLFTLDTYSSNGQSYKISIYDDGDNLIDSFEKKLSSGVAGTIKHYFVLASGSYSVKVENTTAWSRGYLTSFVVTEPSLLTLNDTDESNSTISDNYRTGTLDIKISRTIVAGMYNTICLPFDVDATLLKEVFGNDVNLREMSSATIEGEVLSLNFNASTSIYRGTPYLIKTSSNIVDPIFVDVEIKEKVGQASGEEEDAAEFIGTFIKKDITANENNLFLGSENKLYFSTEDVTIKGFRGYFNITAAAGAPKRARLVMDEENIATEIELINGQLPEIFDKKVLKTIDNGQLLIIRDGAYYNVMGQIVK